MKTLDVPNLTTHHDGHGLNESLFITYDERDPFGGGASHHYTVTHESPPDEGGNVTGTVVATIQFQHGPRKDPKSKSGVTEAAIYAILIDRLEAFQAGPFACPENESQLRHLRACLESTKARADERAGRGVLGKNEE